MELIELVELGSAPSPFGVAKLKSAIREHSACLVRGLSISTPDALAELRAAIGLSPFSYVGGNSPRKHFGREIFTVSEYSPTEPISLHNELSYSASWPGFLIFNCSQPASKGGETLIASNQEFTRLLPAALKNLFAAGVVYESTMTERGILGVSWRNVFPEMSREMIDKWCTNAGIQTEWLGDNRLRTRQIRPAFRAVAEGRDLVWFCQADQWHPAALKPELRSTLRNLLPESEFPHNAYLPSGALITDDVIFEIQALFRSIAQEILLQSGELLILNNESIAHGRNSYVGPRRIQVALAGEELSKDPS